MTDRLMEGCAAYASAEEIQAAGPAPAWARASSTSAEPATAAETARSIR